MECLYISNLDINAENILIEDDEFRHLKALHTRIGESILISNGNGTLATVSIIDIERRSASARIVSKEFVPKVEYKLGLALGILDNKDRFEFALEKAVELGATDFYPLLCRYSQKQKVNSERLENKAISAIKQSKRAWNITIHNAITIEELLNLAGNTFYFSDMDSSEKLKYFNSNSVLIVGPEGGFSAEEESMIRNNKVMSFTLGNNRLRAETAAIAGLSIINNYLF